MYFYNARFYDASLGRFTQPDTIVPEPGNPQALNRYSYVLNNPIRYTDPNGHCGPLTPLCVVLVLAGIGLLIQDDVQTPGEPFPSPESVNSQRLGGALLVAGGSAAVGSLVLGVGAVGTAGEAATAACADGDCTNEVRSAGQASQDVWKFDPFRRGAEIETKLGGRSPDLVYNFPGIDRFKNGVATSMKSIDLHAKTYQDIGALTNKVQGYVNELASWQGAKMGGAEISASQITARELALAIPQGATQAQLAALQQLQQWASTVGVTVNITVVP